MYTRRKGTRLSSQKGVRFCSMSTIIQYDRMSPPRYYQQRKRVELSRSQSAGIPSSITRPSKDPLSISLNDICRVAERERQTWSARSRRQAVATAHTGVRQMDSREGLSSRPNTSASRHIHALRRETLTPKSVRSEPLPSRVSSRQDGDVTDDNEHHYPLNSVSLSSPVCCEVIGPQACGDCHRHFRQVIDKHHSETLFRTLRISNGNLTTAAILKNYLPNLSYEQIQDKIARGEIAKNFLPKNPSVERFKEEEKNDVRNKQVVVMDTHSHHLRKEKWRALSELYFVNIRDLNNKITSGRVSKALGFSHSDKRRELLQRPMPQADDNAFPAFVSPKKVTLVNEPAYRSYFDPPLLPRTMQLPEPSFFAGSTTDYKLPDRLPEEILFQEKEKPPSRKNSALSASDVEELEYEKDQVFT